MKRLKSFLFIAAISLAFPLHAQFWAEGIGGNDVDEVMDVCTDNSGAIISAGYFTNAGNFGSSVTLSSASNGVPDIFVQKANASGNVMWAVRAGGIGSDRALGVKTDASGNIYITGFYFGSATFGSFTLNSVNGSKDAFIAKLNSSGNFLWAVSAGGTMADIGNSIDVDASGNVFVAGQFEGTATFGSATYTSMVNPSTGFSSIDVFISKLDNSGNFLWTKHGKAKYTDRAMDVAVDNNGNAFVCGQFSDTIQFANTYNNAVMNAVFLLKLDGNGNEIWFRRASGTYSMAYSVAIDNSQNVYMTGDYQGTLAFYGTPTNFLSDNYSNRVFLVKYSNAGNYTWSASSSSDNMLSARGVAIDPNNDPYIAGEFGCTLNDYADVYGQGTFNSVGFADIFTTKFNASGQFQWARNFGGPLNDRSHGIVVKTANVPLLAGSFEKRVTWPVTSLIITSDWNTTGYQVSQLNSSYCSDPYYGYYGGLKSQGYSDGFVAFAIDVTRQPYDYYYRNGTSCLRDYEAGCIDSLLTIYTCHDTAKYCGTGTLYANTWTGSGTWGTIGPDYHFQWNTGPNDTLYYKQAGTSNYYSVQMTSRDGCYHEEDTIYAVVNPVPAAPTISDDHNVNIQHPQWGLPVTVCAPDSVWLWAGNFPANDSVDWYSGSGPYGNLYAANDSAEAFAAGYYNVVVTNAFGCYNYNRVEVRMDSSLLPIAPKSLIPDTFVICAGQPVRFWIYDTINNPSANLNYQLHWIHNGWNLLPALSVSSNNMQMTGWCYPNVSGNYALCDTIIYYNGCDRDTFLIHDTTYIDVRPVPSVSVSVTGPQFLCPGDTTTYIVNANPSTTLNTSLTFVPNDTILFWAPGILYANVTITDTITGCFSLGYTSRTIQPKPNPVVSTSPASGLICPNDSVWIWCQTPGISYTWIGPNGILAVNAQGFYDSVPGFYHCIVMDYDSCVLTSNTIELKQYNTPYLVANPGTLVCLNQSVTLQVITNDSTLIQWLPPLSGGGTHQVVTQAGTYSCNVTMCGITTLCSITVVYSQAVAQISGQASVCPGDSIWLHANAGMATYNWLPQNSTIDSVLVPIGTYTLVTSDANGCTATDSFTVAADTSTARPLTTNATICSGSTATLTATAVGPVTWYSVASGGIPLGSGNTFVTPPLFTQTIYYAETVDSSGCHSLRRPAIVFIDSTSLQPVAFGTDSVCNGATIALSTNTVTGASYNWSGPNGFTSTQQNPSIANATAAAGGWYTLYLAGANCTSAPDSFYVAVLTPVTPIVSWIDSACEGNTNVQWIVNIDSNATYHWSGPNNFSANDTAIYLGPVDSTFAGTYTLYATIGACASMTDTFSLTVLPSPPPFNIYSNTPLCPGDTLFLSADTLAGVTYTWLGGSNGFFSTQQNPVIANVDSTYMDFYMAYVTNSFGCMSQQAWTWVSIYPAPQTSLGNDTTICESAPIMLQPTGNFPSYQWQDNSTGSTHIADSTQYYWVMATDSNGCTATDSIYITAINCRIQGPNIFTPNGDGVNDYFTFAGMNVREAHCEIYNRYGTLVYSWNDPQGSWDGTNLQTNKPVSAGVYYYTAHVVSYDGKPVDFKGFIQLMR